MEKVDTGPQRRMWADASRGRGDDGEQPMTRVTEVAACTMAAAHRRDHEHRLGVDHCHPHVVEGPPRTQGRRGVP